MKILESWDKLNRRDKPNLPADQQIPQFEAVIKRGSASYSQFLDVLHGMNNKDLSSEQRQIYSTYYPCIKVAFERKNGDILHSYQSCKTKAGVILTEGGFFIYYDFKKSKSPSVFEAQKLLIRCDRLAIEARRFLKGPHFQACSELIYSASENLLLLIDDYEENTENTEKSTDNNHMLELIKEQLNYADKHFNDLLPVAYQRDYYIGMIRGFFLLVLLIMLIGTLIWFIKPGESGATSKVLLDYELLMASLIGGGLGAMVSMMSRLSSGDVGLNGQVGPTALQRVGILRPLIGAIFGAVIFAVIESGLISHINPNNENGNKLLLYAALGFAAGFSERWVPDMLSVALRSMDGRAEIQTEKSAEENKQVQSTINTNSKKKRQKISY